MAGVGHPSVSVAAVSDGQGHPMKRNVAMAGLDSSPGSIDDIDEAEARDDKKRQPVKRACNECRQQKVSFLARLELYYFPVDANFCSCDAMWFRIRTRLVRDVAASNSIVKSNPTSNGSGNAAGMRRWSERSSN